MLFGLLAVLAGISLSWVAPTAKGAPGGISPTAPALDGFIDTLYGSPDASVNYVQSGGGNTRVSNGLIAVIETSTDYYIAFQQPLTIKSNAYCASKQATPGCIQNFSALVGSDHIDVGWNGLAGKNVTLVVDTISQNPSNSGNYTGRLKTLTNNIGDGNDSVGCPDTAMDGYSGMDWNWNVAQWHDQLNSPNFAGQPNHDYIYPSTAEYRISKAGCGLPDGLKDQMANTVVAFAHNSPDSGLTVVEDIQCTTPTPPAVPVGTPQTATFKVSAGGTTGGFPQPTGGEKILTFLQGQGSITSVNGVPGTTGTTDAQGNAAVVVNSTQVGNNTITAVADLNKNGVWDQADEPVTTPGCLLAFNQPPGDARISIHPDGINEVNHNHVFTAKVETTTDNTNWTPAPKGTVIDFAKASGVGDFVNGVDSCTTQDTSGSCTATITSPDVGATTVSATSTVNVGGQNLKRSTDPAIAPNGPGGSGNATKHWVDGYIKVTPVNALNPVNVQHVFTVEFGLLGDLDAVSNVSIQPTLNPTPATHSSTCATPTAGANHIYTCTITINSPDPGLFLADATGTATLSKTGVPGSATLTRSTDSNIAPHGPGGNDGGQKQYENARISIHPDGINEVNHTHTFTATVQTQDVKNGPWVNVPDGTKVDFAKSGVGTFVSPGLAGGNPCFTVLNSGSCVVGVTSPDIGSTTVSATSTVNINGQSLTVSTDPTIAPNGPGGSGNATKFWVNGHITVTPNALNPVNTPHTFNVAFTLEGPNDGISNVSIVPGVSPKPATQSDTCATPAKNGSVYSCSITINSPDPGVFTATATGAATLHKTGGTPESATVTRSTDGQAPNSGPAVKVYEAARISIHPDGINEVNHTHTFTATVQTKTGDAANWVNVPDNTKIDFAKSGVGSFVGGVNSCATTGGTGSCTATITSPVIGATTVSATSTVTVDTGKTLKVSTDPTIAPNGPGGSGNAIKHWEDAYIKVTPDATNPVKTAHVFTAEFGLLGDFDGVSGVSIVPNVSPAPATQSDTCATPAKTGNVYTCTITINSADPGVFKATATGTATLTKSGVPGSAVLTRSTDAANHGPGGNEGATKVYEDARISITPDGINEVTHNHTFTATVETKTGKGDWVKAPKGTVIDFAKTGVGDFVSGNNCTTPDASGSCSVAITSADVGSTVVSATSTVDVSGKDLKRSTDPTIAPNGPGGSDNAIKHWVDGYIKVTPDGVNPVGKAHTFTAEFGLLGTPDSVTGVSIVPKVTPVGTTPAPTSQSDTCATPTAGANHVYTCTITINSDTAGVYKATATGKATLTKAGIPGSVNLTRATDATSHGPGGNEGATKVYVDAFVTIGPSATNPVNVPHTFDVTVTAITSGATPVTFDSIETSVAPAPLTEGSTCATPTVSGNTATCKVTINSNVVGHFTANVTAKVSIGGATVVRSTDSTVASAGPGGSGPATKDYVNVLGEQFQRPPLAVTGTDLGWRSLIGLLLLVGGVGLRVMRRRNRRSEA